MHTHKRFWYTLVVILLGISLCLFLWFIIDLDRLYATGELRPTRGFDRTHQHKQTFSPNQIDSWMTFSYVNYTFSLPPDYLANSLSITDSQYPEISITRYVQNNHLDLATTLEKIRQTVLQFTSPSIKTN